MSEEKKIPPPNYLLILQRLMDNDLAEQAIAKIKEWGLKIEIKDGKLIDISNTVDAWLRRFITSDSKMMAMKEKVRKLSKVDDEVLIIGETGTGKEIIARALHGDREGEFVAVNCAGIPETLVESLLFGHVKGSFTSADVTKNGLLKIATNGSVFFDEIGELPLVIQAKFLRALQEKRIRKIGADKEEEINCRVIAATHRNLEKMMDDGLFREDLYARISTYNIHLLPIKDRLCDIIPIIESMDCGPEFLKAMQHRQFPKTRFNVRSLQQLVKRYKLFGELPE